MKANGIIRRPFRVVHVPDSIVDIIGIYNGLCVYIMHMLYCGTWRTHSVGAAHSDFEYGIGHRNGRVLGEVLWNWALTANPSAHESSPMFTCE